MSRLTEWMDITLYPDFKDNWDDDLFRKILEEKINSGTFCLDYGAGRGNVKQMDFMSVAKFVAGVDPDKGVIENPYLNEAKLLDLENLIIPYSDNTFDIVFSDNVMEHVRNPGIAFKEIVRVLKPGGVFLSKTPNKWHYMPIIARVTPTGFHKLYNKLRGRDEKDTFPTVYKCNTLQSVVKLAHETGFECEGIQFIEGRPEYLRLATLTYLFGFLYERIVNLTGVLATFRCVIIFELKKKSITHHA